MHLRIRGLIGLYAAGLLWGCEPSEASEPPQSAEVDASEDACGPDADCAGSEPQCEQTTTEIAFDEPTPLGDSAAGVLAKLMGEHPAVLRWNAGGSVDMTASVTYDGGAVTLSKYAYADGTEDYDCSGVDVTVEAEASLVTADGALDETWATTILLEDDRTVSIGGTFELDELQGSYEDPELSQIGVVLELAAGSSSVNVNGRIDGGTPTTPPADGRPGTPGQVVSVAEIGAD